MTGQQVIRTRNAVQEGEMVQVKMCVVLSRGSSHSIIVLRGTRRDAQRDKEVS